MSDSIGTKSIGYMTYNKFNVFMTLLFVIFSIIFALFSDRMNSSISLRTVLIIIGVALFTLITYFWMLHYSYQ
jgi:phosphatidylglycerophosphate synthase